MTIDVKRAYFYAPATRPVYIRIPKEDLEEGDEDKVGVLQLSLYGTRDAAMNWAATYTKVLVQNGFIPGRCSPCNFRHVSRDIAMTVHGDDFTCSGSEEDLAWLEEKMKEKFEIKVEILGPDARRHKQEIRVLNRVLRWTKEGIQYEPDQRHAEIVVRELGLTEAKKVTTPGCREDAGKAGPPCIDGPTVTQRDMDPECTALPAGPLLPPLEARAYRGVSARLNYLAQDRADIQFACKEAARRMAKPAEGDWALLKRVGRYLVGAPRYVQNFYWQDVTDVVDTHTDSDWAGCKASGRSTSGGAMRLGMHCVKTWSTTQATVALSSAEAELYALIKGAAQTLGMMSLLSDFGMTLKGVVHTDANAAVGIVQRQGLGKLRHLRVQYLWIQDKVRGGDVGLHKVHGPMNPADLMTKHLAAEDMRRHLETLCVKTALDRADTAPKLAKVTTVQATTTTTPHNTFTVTHHKPRLELATPLRVSGAPPAKALTPTRLTRGRFVNSGERFELTDTWTSRSEAHRCLPNFWTGETFFFLRTRF